MRLNSIIFHRSFMRKFHLKVMCKALYWLKVTLIWSLWLGRSFQATFSCLPHFSSFPQLPRFSVEPLSPPAPLVGILKSLKTSHEFKLNVLSEAISGKLLGKWKLLGKPYYVCVVAQKLGKQKFRSHKLWQNYTFRIIQSHLSSKNIANGTTDLRHWVCWLIQHL